VSYDSKGKRLHFSPLPEAVNGDTAGTANIPAALSMGKGKTDKKGG
jgi:hypothetical protein